MKMKRFLKSLEEELNNDSNQIWSQSTPLVNSFPIYEAEIYSKMILSLFLSVKLSVISCKTDVALPKKIKDFNLCIEKL